MKQLTSVICLLSTLLVACNQSTVYSKKAELSVAANFEGDFQTTEPPRILMIQESAGLRDYLEDVIEKNKDLKSLSATIQAFEFREKTVAAESLPKLDANLTGQRDKTDKYLKPTNTVNLNLNIKWAVDIWGKLSDESKVARLQTMQQELEYQNARRVLVAQAMQTWLSFGNIQQQESILKQRVNNALNLVHTTEDYYQNGETLYDDLIQKRIAANLLQEEQEQIFAQKQIHLHRFNILRGQLPKAPANILLDSMQPVVVTLPKEIPATALQERPDILAAFKQIEILDAKTKAAHKALLPQINLTGDLNKSSSSLADILSGDLLWQLVGGLTQPLFNGGQLKNQAKQKSKEAESSYYKYEQVVFNAMEEVENALTKERSLLEQMDLTRGRLYEMEKRIHSLKESYKDGTTDVQQYLTMQEQYLVTQYEWVTTQEKYLSNRITLALAIGHSLEGKGE